MKICPWFLGIPLLLLAFAPNAHAQAGGSALLLDGVDDYVSVADTGSFDFNNAFTIEAWVKPLSLAGPVTAKAIVQGAFTEPPFTGGSWVMLLGLSDYSQWGLSVCVPECESALSGSGNLQVGVWQHLAGTYDGTNITTYKNGVLVASTPWSGNVGDVNFVLIGIWDISFKGLIDEVRIWKTSRTQAEIQSTMNQPLAGNETGLVGYWPFNEGSGTSANDRSGHGNVGILKNFNFDNTSGWVSSDAPLVVSVPGVTRAGEIALLLVLVAAGLWTLRRYTLLMGRQPRA